MGWPHPGGQGAGDAPEAPVPPASLVVPALIRMAHQAGGFATVLRKGSVAGTSLLLVVRKDGRSHAFERVPDFREKTSWKLAATGDEKVDPFLQRQQRFDDDLWILELDVADPARFIPGFPDFL